ncbi:MAG: flagellar biosynthetic protein FliO [Bacillota bacterium]|nr:flagellar biosynthetic protein FliO [Bacillota bacterium]
MGATVTVFKAFVYLIGFGSILFLTYITTKFIGTKVSKVSKGKHISVIDTVTLGMNKQLYLVKAGNEFILMASSGKNLEFIKEIKLDEADMDENIQVTNNFDFKALFDKYFQNIKNKKTENQETTNNPFSTGNFKSNLQRLRGLSSKFGKPAENYGDDNSNEK